MSPSRPDSPSDLSPARKPPNRPLRAFLILLALAIIAIAVVFPALAPARLPKDLVWVPKTNPTLQAAIRQAQSQLGSFITEIQTPKAGRRTAVLAGFRTPDGNEYLWLGDIKYQDGTFQGTLEQQPVSYTGAKKGDLVTVRRADIYDWAIKDGDKVRGRFTSKVLGGP